MAERVVPNSNIVITFPPQKPQKLNEDLVLDFFIRNLGRDAVPVDSRVVIEPAGIYAEASVTLGSELAPKEQVKLTVTVPVIDKYPDGPREESIRGLVHRLPISIEDPNYLLFRCNKAYLELDICMYAESFLSYIFPFSDNPRSPYSDCNKANIGCFGSVGFGKTTEINQLLRLMVRDFLYGQQNPGDYSQTKLFSAPSLNGYDASVKEPHWRIFDCFGVPERGAVHFLEKHFPLLVRGLVPKDFCLNYGEELLKFKAMTLEKSLQRRGKVSEMALHCCVFIVTHGSYAVDETMQLLHGLIQKTTSDFGITPMLIITRLDDIMKGFTGDFDNMTLAQQEIWQDTKLKFSTALGVLPENVMGVANTCLNQTFGQQKNHALILWKILKNAESYIRSQNSHFVYEEVYDMAMAKDSGDGSAPDIHFRDDKKEKPKAHYWTTDEVLQWMDNNRLGHLKDTFSQHAVDGRSLLDLTHDELRTEMGIHQFGDRKAILHEVRNLHLQY